MWALALLPFLTDCRFQSASFHSANFCWDHIHSAHSNLFAHCTVYISFLLRLSTGIVAFPHWRSAGPLQCSVCETQCLLEHLLSHSFSFRQFSPDFSHRPFAIRKFSLSHNVCETQCLPEHTPPFLLLLIFTRPNFTQPIFTRPVFIQPIFTQPIFIQPIFTQTIFTQRIFTQSIFTKPIFTQPIFTLLIFTQPISHRQFPFSPFSFSPVLLSAFSLSPFSLSPFSLSPFSFSPIFT